MGKKKCRKGDLCPCEVQTGASRSNFVRYICAEDDVAAGGFVDQVHVTGDEGVTVFLDSGDIGHEIRVVATNAAATVTDGDAELDGGDVHVPKGTSRVFTQTIDCRYVADKNQ